jgi:hypothetical protein
MKLTTKIRGVAVHIACDYCEEKGRVPGGKYRAEGEVIDCPVCDGQRTTLAMVSLDDFKRWLA